VVVDKLSPQLGKQITRGQIIVFHDPGNWLGREPVQRSANPFSRWVKKSLVFVGLLPSDGERDLIKRVIGVPGDRVRCCDPQGRVTVNGTSLVEPYVFPNNPPSVQRFDVTVPKGRLWVMGDHRSESADSRFHLGDPGQGTVPIRSVVGPAFVVLWPPSHLGRLTVPATFAGRHVTPPAAAAIGTAVTLPMVLLRRRNRRPRRVNPHGRS
jgi:signal peptidase I